MPIAPARITLILSYDPAAAADIADEILQDLRRRHPGVTVIEAPAAETWPFRHPLPPALPDGPVIVRADGLEHASANRQTGATRLVTTQSLYLATEWEAALEDHGDAWLVATAGAEGIAAAAPEIAARRGVFARADVREAGTAAANAGTGDGDAAPARASSLAAAFRSPDPAERLRLCVQALDEARTPAALVAAASTCMEVNDLDAAARDLDEAIALAPAWAAPRFERGKLWLRRDDMEQAAASFRDAVDRLPGFGPAWANLGATLGELDRPQEALAAFERALADDPDSPQAVNNVGVVSRELGRLAESEAAFRRVTALAPDSAFGYYNLGHTLFLQGRYHGALTAYGQGQARDAERNPVQATRLAMCQLATGDATGALGELERATSGLPAEYRRQLLADTNAIAWALITHKPDVPGFRQVHDWLTRELRREQ